MPKNDKRDNYRIEVYPRAAGDFGVAHIGSMTRTDAEERALCDEIARDIRRHVDNVGSVQVVSDSTPECSYCGAWWTEDSPDYNGGCCDKDEAHNPSPEVSHA